MNRMRWIVACAVVALPSAAFSLTGDLPQPSTNQLKVSPTDPANPTVPQGIVTGKATAIDAVLHRIQLQDVHGKMNTFYVATPTPIYARNRRQLSFNDLNVGDALSVQVDSATQHVLEIDRR